MISPKALLFLAIQQKIATITNGEEDAPPLFTFVERDMGQLDTYGKPPVKWPCVMIRIQEGSYESIGNNARAGVFTVTVRIGFPPYSSTGLKVPAKYRNKALYYWDLEQYMYLGLQGWAPRTVTVVPAAGADPALEANLSDIFGHLDCTQDMEEDREDFTVVAKQIYTIGIDDYSAATNVTLTPVTLNLTSEIDDTI